MFIYDNRRQILTNFNERGKFMIIHARFKENDYKTTKKIKNITKYKRKSPPPSLNILGGGVTPIQAWYGIVK